MLHADGGSRGSLLVLQAFADPNLSSNAGPCFEAGGGSLLTWILARITSSRLAVCGGNQQCSPAHRDRVSGGFPAGTKICPLSGRRGRVDSCRLRAVASFRAGTACWGRLV